MEIRQFFGSVLISLVLGWVSFANAEGDLTLRPIALEDLVMGSEESDYQMSQNHYLLETGQAYRLRIVASGLKPYALKAPEFFSAIYLRKVEAGDMEIKAVSLLELEFEEESEAEIFFVPVKPGRFPFYVAGLEHKGMSGIIEVK